MKAFIHISTLTISNLCHQHTLALLSRELSVAERWNFPDKSRPGSLVWQSIDHFELSSLDPKSRSPSHCRTFFAENAGNFGRATHKNQWHTMPMDQVGDYHNTLANSNGCSAHTIRIRNSNRNSPFPMNKFTFFSPFLYELSGKLLH